MHYRYAFHTESFSRKWEVHRRFILLTSYEVRSRSPGQISCSLSPSLCPSVITGCVLLIWLPVPVRYGTMARRRRRSWLAKRAEPGTHVPTTHKAPKAPLLARRAKRHFISYTTVPVPVYTLLRLTVHTGFKSRRLLTLFFSFFDHTGRAAEIQQATVL